MTQGGNQQLRLTHLSPYHTRQKPATMPHQSPKSPSLDAVRPSLVSFFLPSPPCCCDSGKQMGRGAAVGAQAAATAAADFQGSSVQVPLAAATAAAACQAAACSSACRHTQRPQGVAAAAPGLPAWAPRQRPRRGTATAAACCLSNVASIGCAPAWACQPWASSPSWACRPRRRRRARRRPRSAPPSAPPAPPCCCCWLCAAGNAPSCRQATCRAGRRAGGVGAAIPAGTPALRCRRSTQTDPRGSGAFGCATAHGEAAAGAARTLQAPAMSSRRYANAAMLLPASALGPLTHLPSSGLVPCRPAQQPNRPTRWIADRAPTCSGPGGSRPGASTCPAAGAWHSRRLLALLQGAR